MLRVEAAVDLVGLPGDDTLISMTIDAFQISLPDGVEAPLPGDGRP